ATAFRDLITYITEISRAADALSRGDLTVTVPPRSSRDVLAQHFLQVTETLQGLVEETGGLIQAGQEGRLHHRGNASRFQGCYADLIDRINKMLDAILSPIQEASTVLEHVAARDLTVCMTGTYQGNHAQIKTALNTTVQNLNEGLHQVAIAAEQVAAASKQISAGNQSLAQGTSEQASALAKISGTLQAMASMSQQNAANAREARTLSENASQVTEKGTRSMQRLSEAIARIKNSADETTKVVQAIDDIAFQTNLLALNAAVEAARAGEAGKGFAVVAEEVRNLAMRSAEAAKSTARLIEESMHNAEEGVILNQEVLQNLEAINVQVEQVSTVMAEIAASSNQQQQGLEQIKMAMEEINQITQQNAAHSEETASAAEELSGQAELLQKLVATFHLAPGKASQIEGADQVSVAYELTV
ncbi:MAG: methyl-accepting chemotaxis protein, partial [Nitrospinota bacterium]